jgi:hypothetical protein
MARIMVVALLVCACIFILVREHVAEGKQPAFKTIANIVVHAHHHTAHLR